jgi:hypothetical protein
VGRLRNVTIILTLAVTAAACSPSSEQAPSTTSPDETTTSLAPPPPSGDLVPPDTVPATDVAQEHLIVPKGFTVADDIGLFEQDALTAIRLWLPDVIVAGTADAVYTSDTASITVVSVIPTMEWRGDPNVVPALASLDATSNEVSPGIYTTTTESGLEIWLWSTGDGFLVATSLDDGPVVDYLSALEAEREALPVWVTGDCLYFPPDEGLPWAPVTIDRVVPCTEPHNAEVLRADQAALSGDIYDAEAVSYERNYACDEAYEETLGPQKDRLPHLITYMPDEDEFSRGDRYLACVVELDTNDGPVLTVGRLADRSDLTWIPIVGTCYTDSLAPVGVDCTGRHAYQFVGTAEVSDTLWPADTSRFSAACDELIDSLQDGPARVEAFAMGLYPYAFERGDRTVRCMAFATDGEFLLDVIGGFEGSWTVLDGSGIPA